MARTKLLRLAHCAARTATTARSPASGEPMMRTAFDFLDSS
jgi:hypothetical protein